MTKLLIYSSAFKLELSYAHPETGRKTGLYSRGIFMMEI